MQEEQFEEEKLILSCNFGGVGVWLHDSVVSGLIEKHSIIADRTWLVKAPQLIQSGNKKKKIERVRTMLCSTPWKAFPFLYRDGGEEGGDGGRWERRGD